MDASFIIVSLEKWDTRNDTNKIIYFGLLRNRYVHLFNCLNNFDRWKDLYRGFDVECHYECLFYSKGIRYLWSIYLGNCLNSFEHRWNKYRIFDDENSGKSLLKPHLFTFFLIRYCLIDRWWNCLNNFDPKKKYWRFDDENWW